MVYFPSRARCTPKCMTYLLFFISFFVFLHLWSINQLQYFTNNVDTIFSLGKRSRETKPRDTILILMWSNKFEYIINKYGKVIFSTLNCTNKNCIFIKDRAFFGDDYTKFNALLFNDAVLNSKNRPAKRDPSQFYVFNTMESSYTVPACEIYNDGFFNMTFTYRLDSDIVWSYFVVRNLKGAIVAPSKTVRWRRSIRPVRQKIKAILEGKKKAAAWLVSHCRADSLRDEYLTTLQEHLFHFALKIDVYGKCSRHECPNGDCNEMIKKDYYFYMAFENSLAEDYVTEKVLHGYNNYAVPVVYGGANYTRFLPAGSYINARQIHPYNLAFAMYQAIKTPALYETYFKWTNLYTVNTDFRDRHPLCNFCDALHRKAPAPAKEKFRLWWNGLNGFKWCLSNEYWNETANVNLDASHIFRMY